MSLENNEENLKRLRVLYPAEYDKFVFKIKNPDMDDETTIKLRMNNQENMGQLLNDFVREMHSRYPEVGKRMQKYHGLTKENMRLFKDMKAAGNEKLFMIIAKTLYQEYNKIDENDRKSLLKM